MGFQVKVGGGYADAAAIFTKKNGTYQAVQGAFVKAAGAYQRVDADTYASTGTIGLNINQAVDWEYSRRYVDAVRSARAFSPAGTTNQIVTNETLAAVGVDGWPDADFRIMIHSAQTAINDVSGVYECSWEQSGGGVSVTSSPSSSVSSITQDGPTGKYRLQWTIVNADANPYLNFAGVGAGFLNLKIVRPGYVWDTAQVFTDEYQAVIAALSPGYFRYMQWMRTNTAWHSGGAYHFDSETQVNWADRWAATDTYAGRIAWKYSWESVVEHANFFHKDAWICLPHKASDDYVSNLAAFMLANLNPGLNLYIEISNEMWNSGNDYKFQADYSLAQYIADAGIRYNTDITSIGIGTTYGASAANMCRVVFAAAHNKSAADEIVWSGIGVDFYARGRHTLTAPNIINSTTLEFPLTRADASVTPSNTTVVALTGASDLVQGASKDLIGSLGHPAVAKYRWVGRRLKEIADIFTTAFTGQTSRIRPVLAYQFSNTANPQEWVHYLHTYFGPLNTWLYALSGAPYDQCNSAPADVATALSQMSTALTANAKRMADHVAMALRYGVQFVAYEGGPDNSVVSNTTLRAQISRDAGLATALEATISKMVSRGMSSHCMYELGRMQDYGGGSCLNILEDVSDTDAHRYVTLAGMKADPLPSFDQEAGFAFGYVPASTASATGYDESGVLYDLMGLLNANDGVSTISYTGATQQLVLKATTHAAYTAQSHWAGGLVLVAAAGNYTITPKFQQNTSGGSAQQFQMYVDGVAYGSAFTPEQTGSPFTYSGTDINPVTVELAKGAHIVEWRGVLSYASSTRQIGFKGYTVAAA